MARPKKNTVDYFPHDCNPNRYLKILTSKYGNDGYAVYYRLNEVLGKTPNHSVSYTEPIDKEYLSMEMGTSIEKLDEILTTMVQIGYLDKSEWEESCTIWSDEFVESISDVYDKRITELPTKDSLRGENPSSRSGNKQSKVKKSKVKKRKERLENKGSPFSVEYYQKMFPDKNVPKALDKYYQFYQNHTHQGILKWLEREQEKKPIQFNFTNGHYTVYCSKCGKQEFPNDDFQLRAGSSCCSVEYVNKRPNNTKNSQLINKKLNGLTDMKSLMNGIVHNE